MTVSVPTNNPSIYIKHLYKKDKNAKKKDKNVFQICKIHMQKSPRSCQKSWSWGPEFG